jgi:hypothetical protein
VTVKAWFTISALVLVALAAAVVIRFLAPVDPPPIFVRSGAVRLVGVLDEGCWPQRGSDLRCKEGPDERPQTGTLPAEGKLRVVVAYPAQPDDGSGTITITDSSGDEVLDEKWDESIDYELESGSYTMTADARYPAEAFVRYVFRFRVR